MKTHLLISVVVHDPESDTCIMSIPDKVVHPVTIDSLLRICPKEVSPQHVCKFSGVNPVLAQDFLLSFSYNFLYLSCQPGVFVNHVLCYVGKRTMSYIMQREATLISSFLSSSIESRFFISMEAKVHGPMECSKRVWFAPGYTRFENPSCLTL
jgi:hypothetical protein